MYLQTQLGNNWKADWIYQSEGASNLGSNAGRADLWGVSTSYQLTQAVQFFGSINRVGLLPDQTGLSRRLYEIDNVNQQVNFLHFENPDLKWEDTRNIELGNTVGLWNNRLLITSKYFHSRSSDFIFKLYERVNPDFYRPSYQNFGSIVNQGFELTINGLILQKERFSYRTFTQISFISSRWQDLNTPFGTLEDRYIGPSTGHFSIDHYYLQRLNEGKKVGVLRAPNYLGIDAATGNWILDLPNANTPNWPDDYDNIQGNALPSFQLGSHQQLTWGKWQLDVMLRGVFGHSLLNQTNLSFGGVNYWGANALSSSQNLRQQGLTEWNRLSSYFIENASFLSLHQLAISRALFIKIRNNTLESRLSLIANNLFYLTGYKGADPEPRLALTHDMPFYEFMNTAYQSPWRNFQTGIDNRQTLLPARAFTLMYTLKF